MWIDFKEHSMLVSVAAGREGPRWLLWICMRYCVVTGMEAVQERTEDGWMDG
jgi:hypothetical protein